LWACSLRRDLLNSDDATCPYLRILGATPHVFAVVGALQVITTVALVVAIFKAGDTYTSYEQPAIPTLLTLEAWPKSRPELFA
jgi:hypothetical protein